MKRTQLFIGLCAVCLLVAVGYALFAANRRGQEQQQQQAQVAADAPASPETLAAVMARPHVLYLYSPTGDQYRRVAVASLDAPDKQYLTPLQCQRLYAVHDEGLCLGNNYVGGITSSYNAYTFNTAFDQASPSSRRAFRRGCGWRRTERSGR